MIQNVSCCTLTFLATSMAALLSPTGGTSPEPEKSTKPHELASAELAVLDALVGPWRVTRTHFNTRGEPTTIAKGTEEITWILDQHALQRTYTTYSDATVYRAVGTLTYNASEKKYHGVWFDNTSTTGPGVVKGDWQPDTRTFVFTVESMAKNGAVIKHRVVERLVDEENRTSTTYLLDGSTVVKLFESQYQRSAPCPGKIRTIIDMD